MKSNKIFNFAAISFLVQLGALLSLVVFNDFFLFNWVFWIAFASLVGFSAVTVVLKISEYIQNESESRSFVDLVANLLAIEGLVILVGYAMGNLYGVFTWSIVISDAFAIAAAILLLAAGVTKLVALIIKMVKSPREKGRPMTFEDCLSVGVALFMAFAEGFFAYINFGNAEAWFFIPVIILFGIGAFLSVVFTVSSVSLMIEDMKKGEVKKECALDAVAKMLLAMGAVILELGAIWLALVILFSFNFIAAVVLSLVAMALLVASLVVKLVDVFKSKSDKIPEV